MLELKQVVAFVVTTSPKLARHFYQDQLGFNFLHDDGFALVFDAHGTMLRVGKLQVGQFIAPQYTVMGWEVPDITSAVLELKRRGVRFENYDPMPQDRNAIWTAPNGDKVAWFKDPDGNLLSISQHLPRPNQEAAQQLSLEAPQPQPPQPNRQISRPPSRQPARRAAQRTNQELNEQLKQLLNRQPNQ